MKTKRTNGVAKIAFTLLIVVTLFFSIGAGYQAGSGSEVIYNTIEKYDALKVIADALQYEVVEEAENTVAIESKEIEDVLMTVSYQADEKNDTEENTVEETVEEVVEETVVEEKAETTTTATTTTATTVTNNTSTNNTTTNNTTNNNAAAEAAKKAEEEAARKAAAEAEAARKAQEEAEAARRAEEAAAAEAARRAEEEAAAEAARQAEAEAAAAAAAQAATVQEWSIGLPGGTMNYYTGIDYNQLCNNLQGLIDAGYIVKYNNYFAGHNPGAMGHLSGIGVGSTVRVSWGGGSYADYTIVSHSSGSGSFADINFPGYGNLWDIVNSESGIVIQFCIGGVNNFFLGY